MVVRTFDYSQFHGKAEPVGSTYIRVDQLIKYWPEAAKYKYGENPDVMIFQKVFCSPDYKFPINFKGIKILDICDPMWLEGVDVVETCHAMDVVTVPTESLAEFIRQFHKNVIVVPDRFDLETIPPPKAHQGLARTVVWFGYSHNIDTLRPAMDIINEMNFNLVIISNDDPIANRWAMNRPNLDWYTYIRYNEDTIYEDIQRADFAIFPDGMRPIDRFKSNNKTIKANLAGLPVAKTADEVRHYIKATNRTKWFDTNYDNIKTEYDVRKSVTQMERLIDEIKRSKT